MKFFRGLSRNTYLLALTSLLADVSTEMLYPILPIFLTTYLGATGSIVGLIEGVATATQNIQMGLAGYISDRVKKRKSLAVLGYFIAAISKPLIGASQTWPVALTARFLDRLGTGTRSAPRDALIAASADTRSRGKAFGLEGIGDNLGAFIGPIVTIILLYLVKVGIRSIFYLALIPGALALLMIFFVTEKKGDSRHRSKIEINLSNLPASYWKYIIVISIFGVGNISSSFMILQTKNIGVPLIGTILIYSFFNLVASFVSYPSGVLSDKFGRKIVIFCSFIFFMITLLGFATTKNFFLIAVLFGFYGVYQGIFRSVGKAAASDFVDEKLEATVIGVFNGVIGITGLIASVLAGIFYDKIGHQFVFIEALIFVIFGTIAFALSKNK